jgi:hypothetical protein
VASATYQPLDADLTSLASASGSGIYERSGGSWTPVVIGTGLSLAGGALSNTLDLSSYLTSSVASATYLPLAGGTLTGDLLFTDATYDIGKSGATRPRDGFFSRNLTVGNTITASSTISTTSPVTMSLGIASLNGAQPGLNCASGTLYLGSQNNSIQLCAGNTERWQINSSGHLVSNGALNFTTTGTVTCGAITASGAIYASEIGNPSGNFTVKTNSADTVIFKSVGGTYHWTEHQIRYGHNLVIGDKEGVGIPLIYTSSTAIHLGVNGGYSNLVITGSAITASGNLSLVNSTTAMQFDLYNTYTSATSFERLTAKAVAASAYQIGSAIGSAGGTTRNIDLGYWNSAGTFKQVATFSTTGIFVHEYPYRSGEGISITQATNDGRITATRNLSLYSTYGSILISDTNQYLFFGGGGQSFVGGTTSVYLRSAKSGNIFINPTDGYDNSGGTYVQIRGCHAWSSSTGTITGGAVLLNGGNGSSGSSGTATGGAVTLTGGTGYGTGVGGAINLVGGSGPVSGGIFISQGISTSGSPTLLTVTAAAHTTLTASTEATDVNFNLARTVQFATGALTTQRAMRIQAPTYSFVGGSTITTASTLSISGPPVAGTNATITNAYALNVESGKIRAVGGLVVGTTDGFNNSLDIGNGLVQAWASGYSCLVMNFGGNPLSYHANWGLGGIQLQDRSAGFGWSSLSNNLTNFDAAFYSPAANIIEQRRTTNAQTFRVYSTYTSSTAYELINIKGKASANFEIGPENGSAGGTLRGLTLGCYPAGTATIVGWAQFRPNTSTGVLEAFYLGPIADSTATGGNARGTNAVDLQILRTGAGQVASGAGSFLAGRRGTASGGGSFCFGDDSAATGQFAVAIGCFANATSYGTLAIGINAAASGSQSICISNGNVGSSATAQDAIAVGNRALADRTGIVAIANGGFAANGDAQKVLVALRNKTTDATPVTLYSNGSSTRLTITSGKILYADVLISGIKSDGSAAACYKRKVAIKNVGGTTSLVGTVEAIGTDIEDNASTDVAITADNTNDALDISVTGIAAETWRWVCVVEGLEIAYGT